MFILGFDNALLKYECDSESGWCLVSEYPDVIGSMNFQNQNLSNQQALFSIVRYVGPIFDDTVRTVRTIFISHSYDPLPFAGAA